ncbi:zinc finger protein Aiolos-like isoform X1 [Acipenser ruthenus]|uniref:zinc finger protein Aiolos-like isoform X1 n=1 Tax=Acipenser ruthenus TaxID=7906 RepID=UPI0027405A63|nr:zinc finger protein Aiolos-like isoform X1 [Acipenser ruthenus]
MSDNSLTMESDDLEEQLQSTESLDGPTDFSSQRPLDKTHTSDTEKAPKEYVVQPSADTDQVEVQVKNEQDEDYSRMEEEEGREAAEMMHYTEYNDYDGAQNQASPYAGSRASNGKLSCDICGLACVSLNVLLVHKRSHTGERPFHCTQCGASFTQKGNLLRHIKLHSGEKPFKCHMCSYACRRRDALSGHLRTHSVEKPYKCNHCGRSYKQRSSLEEHKERCHVYMQSKGLEDRASEDVRPAKTQMGAERTLVLDRLASSVAKRKSSMPQKFIGDKRLCLDINYSNSLMYSKESELIQRGMMEQARGYMGAESMRPLIQTPPTGPPPPEMVPVISSVFPLSLTRSDMNGHESEGGSHQHPRVKRQSSNRGPSPSNSGQESPEADSNPQEERGQGHGVYNLGHMLLARPRNGLHHPHPHLHPHPHPHHHLKDLPPRPFEAGRPPLSPHDVFRVIGGEGEAVPAFRCEHCHVLFLDYVMFTIHMGCHGFRDPFECNVCGYRSPDRYEFSSHIARGEHRFINK